MTFDRFTDDWQIGDASEPPELTECIQCGIDFEKNVHAAIDEEFCSDDCEAMHGGIATEMESD